MKTAILFGSTGLVGGLLLNLLIKDENYKKIKIFNRSPVEISSPSWDDWGSEVPANKSSIVSWKTGMRIVAKRW